jgi:hypothetical protein
MGVTLGSKEGTRKCVPDLGERTDGNHDGVIARTLTLSVPVRTDYELTALGIELLPLQRAIKQWAETHIEAVHAARDRYDAISTANRAAVDAPPPA